MLIAVLSPYAHGNGNSITSMCLAFGLGGLNKKVLLTHTDATSESFYTYFGLEQYDDKTSTPHQLVKLLREGAIQPEEITDYCKTVGDGVDVFTTNKDDFKEEDMFEFTDFMLQLSTYDFIIFDVNNLETRTSDIVIKNADIIVWNLTQSVLELKKLQGQKELLLKLCKGKPIVLVCNKYSKTIGSLSDVTKKLGVNAKCLPLSYNPWVPYACNRGIFSTLYKQIKGKGVQVVELDKEINNLATTISKLKVKLMKQKNKKIVDKSRQGGGTNAK